MFGLEGLPRDGKLFGFHSIPKLHVSFPIRQSQIAGGGPGILRGEGTGGTATGEDFR